MLHVQIKNVQLVLILVNFVVRFFIIHGNSKKESLEKMEEYVSALRPLQV